MAAVETGLKALRQTMSRGTKSLLVGLGFSFTVILINTRIFNAMLRGSPPANDIDVPWFPIPISPKAAASIFFVLAGASGWITWAMLRQAFALLYKLEFELGADPEEIRNTLTGGPLITASTLLTRLTAFLAHLSLTVGVPAHWLFADLENELISPFPILISLLASFPYLLILVSFRLSFLNPRRWDSGYAFTAMIGWADFMDRYHPNVPQEEKQQLKAGRKQINKLFGWLARKHGPFRLIASFFTGSRSVADDIDRWEKKHMERDRE